MTDAPTPPAPSAGAGAGLALYRKYRSANFAELIGQEHVTAPLSTALAAGRINHAYLFSGPRGCGKTSSARILARSLNCAQGPTPTPCGVCDSCRELSPNGPGSIDVIEMDAASHNGVDDARDLRERAYYAPARDRYKVYIIDEAHMVTNAAFNALLKLVEEPPDFVIIIFATTEPDKVLQTIRSRTHHYPFRLVPPGVLRSHLERICAAEGATVEQAVYPLIVRAGGGSVRDSLSLLDQLMAGAGSEGVTYQSAVALLGVTDGALLDDMIDALAVGDSASVYATIDRVVEAGHEPRRFAADLLDRLRDLLVLAAVPEAATNGLLDVPADAMERMSDQAERIGQASAVRYAEIVHTALTEMRGTTAPRLMLELVCARMLLPDASSDSAALLQRMERLERRQTLTGDVPPAPVTTAVTPPATEPAAVSARSAASASPTTAAPPTRAPSPAPAPSPTPAPPAATAASAAAAAPPPAPAAGGDLDVTRIRTIWPEVLDVVKQNSRRTRALLETVQIAGLDGSALRLVIGTPALARLLSDPANLEAVASALTTLLGGTWTIEVGVTGDPSSPRPSRPAPAPPRSPQPSTSPAGAEPAADRRTGADSQPAATRPAATKPAANSAGASKYETSKPTESKDDSSAGGWPTVTAIPDAALAADPSRPASATTPSAPIDEVPEDYYDDPGYESPEDEPGDPYLRGGSSNQPAPATRHDPEADALALLQSGLGARPMQD